MAKRKDTQKREELRDLCGAMQELKENILEPRSNNGQCSGLLTKKLMEVLEQTNAEIVKATMELMEMTSKKNAQG